VVLKGCWGSSASKGLSEGKRCAVEIAMRKRATAGTRCGCFEG